MGGGGCRARRELSLNLLLLFSQEVDDELLVVADEVVIQALAGQVLTKVLTP